MMRAYSADLRERVLCDCDVGMKTSEVANKYRVSTAWVRRLKQRRRETGETAPRRGRTGPKPRLREHLSQLEKLVEEYPDATLEDLQQKLSVMVSVTTIWRTLKALGITSKKVLHAAEQDREDVQDLRQGWRFWQAHLDPRRLVFLDETGANTKMVRRYGRAFRSQRLVAKVPHGHWKTTTFVGGLRMDGFVAPLVVDGPMNGDVFRAYVQQHLVKALRPNDIVIMDNLAAHKVAGVRDAIEEANAQLVYLPPYSPDFNPIELAFSKLKSLLRRAGERTVDRLERTIGKVLKQFETTEVRNYFRHCGYSLR